jgi:hypothetical protein
VNTSWKKFDADPSDVTSMGLIGGILGRAHRFRGETQDLVIHSWGGLFCFTCN